MVSNSSVANFVPESRLPILYKSVSFTEKRPRRLGTGFKDGFGQMGHEFLFEIFHSKKKKKKKKKKKNKTTYSAVPLLPEIFRRNEPKSRFPFTFQPDFPETSRKW